MRVENPVPVDQAAFATQLLTTLRGAIAGNAELNELVERAKQTGEAIPAIEGADGIMYSLIPKHDRLIRHKFHSGFHLNASSAKPIIGPYSIVSIKLFERDPHCKASFAPFSLGCIGGEQDQLVDTQEVNDVAVIDPRMTAGDVASDIIDRFARATQQPGATLEPS